MQSYFKVVLLQLFILLFWDWWTSSNITDRKRCRSWFRAPAEISSSSRHFFKAFQPLSSSQVSYMVEKDTLFAHLLSFAFIKKKRTFWFSSHYVEKNWICSRWKIQRKSCVVTVLQPVTNTLHTSVVLLSVDSKSSKFTLESIYIDIYI